MLSDVIGIIGFLFKTSHPLILLPPTDLLCISSVGCLILKKKKNNKKYIPIYKRK